MSFLERAASLRATFRSGKKKRNICSSEGVKKMDEISRVKEKKGPMPMLITSVGSVIFASIEGGNVSQKGVREGPCFRCSGKGGAHFPRKRTRGAGATRAAARDGKKKKVLFGEERPRAPMACSRAKRGGGAKHPLSSDGGIQIVDTLSRIREREDDVLRGD